MPPCVRWTLGRSLLTALLAGCSAATQHAYIAPTSETIISDTEERQTNPPAHLMYVENRSTVPVMVFSVSLSGCQNIKMSCGPRPVRIPVAAGRRVQVLRVEPANPTQGFSYHFGYSWHGDSSNAVTAALAANGDPSAQERLAGMRRADSLRRTETGPRYNELSRDDFKALAARATSMRADPESLLVTPGSQASLERIRLLIVDSQNQVLGRTRWIRMWGPGEGAVRFVPPDRLIARAPGRVAVRFSLADEAQQLLSTTIPDVEVPVVVAYPFDAHAPSFTGLALDADSKMPLACARVALEDSAQNVVSTDVTVATGGFVLQAPRAGTYRVRVESHGWVPAYGPSVLANADEEKQQQYLVRFTEQMLVSPYNRNVSDFQHASPAAITARPFATPTNGKGGAPSEPIVRGVTLGGSPSMPILGIISRVAPSGTTWMQFVVDSSGKVDTTSLAFPAGTASKTQASVKAVLPWLRFSPARDAGKATCELLRMQVNVTPR